jgi:CRP-like cAMP-binding protein
MLALRQKSAARDAQRRIDCDDKLLKQLAGGTFDVCGRRVLEKETTMSTFRSADLSTSHLPIASSSRNKLLASLPPKDYGRLAPHLRRVSLKMKQVLHKQGEMIREVFFLGDGICSLIKVSEDGRTRGIAPIGNEGGAGTLVFLGQHESFADCVVQIPDGGAEAMPVEAFSAEMDQHGAFFDRVIRYNRALTTQMIQTIACIGFHSTQQRFCQWLLMVHDRVGRDEFRMTHESMAATLGVRRPTVTLAARSLQENGILQSRRGYVTILNRAALEAQSCGCYTAVKTIVARLLPEGTGSRGVQPTSPTRPDQLFSTSLGISSPSAIARV